jgi:polysaccharide deacetylase 2 family uncharacterized protein YibQ
MVEIEVSKSEAGTEKASNVKLDVNEIISKVRDFVESFKETSLGGQRMAVDIEGFKFSVGKADGKYDLNLNVNLSFIPKGPKVLNVVETV